MEQSTLTTGGDVTLYGGFSPATVELIPMGDRCTPQEELTTHCEGKQPKTSHTINRPSKSQPLLSSKKERRSGARPDIKTQEWRFVPWMVENAMPRGFGKISDGKCPMEMKFLRLVGPLSQRAPFKLYSSSNSGRTV